MNFVVNRKPILFLTAGLLLGLLLFSCSSTRQSYQTKDLIEFLTIDPGQSTTLPVCDIFFAKSYNLKFKSNNNIALNYSSIANELKLTPADGFTGLSYIHFRNGNEAMILPVIVKSKTEVIFQCAVDEPDVNVFVMGNFNNWSRNSTPMTDDDGDGIFTQSVFLDDGIYEYQFVIGKREIYDPENPVKVDNGFGYFNSLRHVQSANRDSIPKLYFLPNHDNTTIRLAVDRKSEINDITVTALIDNELYPQENIQIDDHEIIVDLNQANRNSETSTMRIVSTYKNLPGNVLTVWLKNGQPVTNKVTFQWQDAIIYSLMIDRFANGDQKNDRPIDHPELNRRANFQGGDFAGITGKIESGYFNDIGVNTLWISPVNKTTDKAWQEWPEPYRYYSGYHGYWPVSPDETEPRFGTMDEFIKLVETAHRYDLKILLDFVSNHVHIEHPYYQEHRDWFGTYDLPDGTQNIRRWDEYRLTTWFDTFLASFDYENSANAVEAMTNNAFWWMNETGIDGFRHDATKHVPYSFWRSLTLKIKSEADPNRPLASYQIGETFGGDDLIKSYVNNGMLESQFNANQYFILRRLFTDPNGDLSELKIAIDKALEVYGYNNLMGNIIGSHDQIRIMGLLEGDITLAENGVERAFREPAIEVNEYSTYLKEQILFCYLMTVPGVPIVFYGDEFGMTGASDPDNRRMMRFDDDLSEFETKQLEAFTQLTNLRNKYSCLRRGDYLNLYTDTNMMVYSRGDTQNRLIILINKSENPNEVSICLPAWLEGRTLESLIGNKQYRISDKKVTLRTPGLAYDVLLVR
ncbi:hypothetical protein KJ762_10225 [bacterium]|nr:hypothetical protein [bacterium]MBU1063547.1 hypothetical protein [bacterium]MBU1634869.1 hypothetical protein [bacterium]MBU1872256.1 hypothetical protein [bacterium]